MPRGRGTGEPFPACDRGLDVARFQVQREADAPQFLSGDDRRAAAAKGVVDRLAGARVVRNRDLEETDGFLGAVPGDPVVGGARAAERIEVRDLPHRRLTAIAEPLARTAHGVPGRFVLPVIVTTTQREVLLPPDNLAADREAGRLQTGGDRRRLHRGMPDVDDAAWEERPRRRPVGAVVVQDPADRGALRGVDPMPPGRVVGDAVRRIGRHHHRCHAVQQARHITGRRRVATEESMAAEDEQVAGDDVGRSRLDHGVVVGQAGGRLREQRREFRGRPERRQIEPVGMQLCQPVDVPFEVEFADAVVRDRERLRTGVGGEVEIVPLDGDQMVAVGLHDAQRNAQSLRVFDRLVAGNDAAVPVDEHRAAGTVLAERLFERGAPAVGAAVRVLGVGCQLGH